MSTVTSSASNATERLSFIVQWQRAVVNAPVDVAAALATQHRSTTSSSSGMQRSYSLYIKWRRGKFFRGKMPYVPCTVSRTTLIPTARSAAASKYRQTALQFLVDLPPVESSQFSFEMNLHTTLITQDSASLTPPHATAEKKELEIEIFLLSFGNNSRSGEPISRVLLGMQTVDLRQWLRHARIGVANSCLVTFDGQQLLEGQFCVSPSSDSNRVAQMARALLMRQSVENADRKATAPHDEAQANGDASRVDCPISLVERKVAFNNVASAAEITEAQCVELTQRTEAVVAAVASIDAESVTMGQALATKYLSPLQTILEKGLFKAITCRLPQHSGSALSVARAFDLLFSDAHGMLGSRFHATRGDTCYQPKPLTWLSHHGSALRRLDTASVSPGDKIAAGVKCTPFRIRIARDKFEQAFEFGIISSLNDTDIVVHLTTVAPKAPIVEDAVFLQALVHILPSTKLDEVTIAMHVYAPITSGKLRLIIGGKVQQQCEKMLHMLITTAQDVLSGHLGRNRSSMRASLTRLRASVGGGASLDPNLWRRLSDERTLPHAATVLQTLQRIAAILPKQSPASSNVTVIENVMGFHRHRTEVLEACCQILLLMASKCGGGGTATVDKHSSPGGAASEAPLKSSRFKGLVQLAMWSPTLASTVASILSLHSETSPNLQTLATLQRDLHLVTAALQEEKHNHLLQQQLLATSSPWWELLRHNIVDSRFVLLLLRQIGTSSAASGSQRQYKRMATTSPVVQAVTSPDTAVADAAVNVLHAALVLHLHDIKIVIALLQLLLKTATTAEEASARRCLWSRFKDFDDAIHEAVRLHGDSNEWPNDYSGEVLAWLQRLESAAKKGDPDPTFHAKYRSAVAPSEDPVFSTVVITEKPRSWAGKLYVTKTSICVADRVMALATLRRVELYRSLLRPAVKLFFVCAADDTEIVFPLFRRDAFLDALRQLSYDWLLKDV